MSGRLVPAESDASHGSRLLRARWLLPVAGPVIEHAWLRLDRGRVAGLGSGCPPSAGHPQPIDLGDAVITPGFINAHTHLEFSALRQPFATDGGLAAWIDRVVAWRRQQPAADGGQLESAIRAGLQESAADGVVALGEIGTASVTISTLRQGPRLRVFRELLGLRPLPDDRPDGPVAAALRDAGRLARAGLAVGLSPHAPYSTQQPLGRSAIKAAGSLRRLARRSVGGRRPIVPLAMHLAESADENDLLEHHAGPFRDLFERLGVWPEPPPRLAATADWISLLARAERGLVIHGTHLPDDPVALARLSRHRDRLAVAICPRTTLALAGRLPPVATFQAAGLQVCLGTDGRGSNPDLSIRAEARCLIEAGIVPPAEALRMVTQRAAWAVGFEDSTGRIAVGRPADLAILRPLSAPATADAAVAAVFAADTQVIATLRGGRIIAGSWQSGFQ